MSSPVKKEEEEKMVRRRPKPEAGQQSRGDIAANKLRRSLKSVESHISTLSQAEYHSPHQTLIVFDWDDTLCPSHWIRSNRPALQYFSPCPNDPKYKKPLLEVAEVVCNILSLAADIGHVVVLTNAQVNWVETSARNFMPSVAPLLQKLKCSIVYARAKFDLIDPASDPRKNPKLFEYNYNANIPQMWKEHAFEGEITKFYSRYAQQSWKNIISIGDQACEHNAVKLVTQARPQDMKKKKCRVKTIKLLEDPTIEDLTAQLHVVYQWLTGVVMYDGDLDVDLGEDDDVIFELHQRLIN